MLTMDSRSRAFAFFCLMLSFACADVAWADDVVSGSPASSGGIVCHFNGGEGGCSRFQGYVFVRHGNDAVGPRGVSSSGDAALSGERLYLGVNSQSEH
jgi:hypothetical protein